MADEVQRWTGTSLVTHVAAALRALLMLSRLISDDAVQEELIAWLFAVAAVGLRGEPESRPPGRRARVDSITTRCEQTRRSTLQHYETNALPTEQLLVPDQLDEDERRTIEGWVAQTKRLRQPLR